MSESLNQTQGSNVLDFDEDEDMLEDIEVEELQPTSMETEKNVPKKRKTRVRSDVWLEYTKVIVKEGDPNKNGTSPLWKHYTTCMKRLEANKSQTVINSDESGSLVSWKFNQNHLRESLVKMLILDELPFRCVEREGFILFMKEAQPLFKIPSRHAIREDCVKMYLTQRTYLRNFFGLNGLGRVSLTTDSWTSCNNTNFICVTAHCIDSSWNLHKKIIGFSKIYSHRGDDLASAIATILDDWG